MTKNLGQVRTVVANIARGLCLGMLAAGFVPLQVAAADDAAPLAQRPKRANFELEHASGEARHVADWIVDSGDSSGMPFAIVDKTQAKVFVFSAEGQLRGAAPALLGLALGDDAVPGIGNREMSRILPQERTTPAGRFVASLDRNLRGVEILWVDYEGAVSMHPVVTSNPAERRLQRLATPTPLDNRISYGCINVPAKFFENVVHTTFTGTNGIVYVLPETRLAREVFALYDVDARARMQAAGPPVPARVNTDISQVRSP
jgi:hypothetical protein